MSDCTKNGLTPFRFVLSLMVAGLLAATPACGDDDDSTTGDDDDDNGSTYEPVAECPGSASCTAVSGKYLCLVSGKPASDAKSCTESGGKTSCPSGLVKANVGDNCFCVLQCLPAGSDTASSDTGSPSDDVPTENQNCKNWINKVCNCSTAPSGACSQVKAAVNTAISAKNEELTCIGKADDFSCPAAGTDTGSSDTGSSDTGGTTGGTGTEDTCPSGTTCQSVPAQSGGTLDYCLAAGNQPPPGAPTCSATDGSGCPSGYDPIGAKDQSGNTVCICLVSCGSTGTTGGGTDTGSGGDCSTAGTTCQTVQNQGGGSAQLCLGAGPSVPSSAPACTASNTCTDTSLVPVQYSTTQGGATMCSCIEPCGSTGTTGGTTGQQGSCDTGLTCTAIQGGNVCLDNGGLPANAPACSGNTCASGLVPVNATPSGGGAAQCVCLSQC